MHFPSLYIHTHTHRLLPSPNSRAQHSSIHPDVLSSPTTHLTLHFSMPPFLYILLGLLLLSHTAPRCSSARDTLMAGQVLAAVGGSKLVSGNGKFALGFFQPAASGISKSSHNATSPSSSWYLGIWFNKIPVFTAVWVANREEPIPHPNINSTKLKFSSDGNLVILITVMMPSLNPLFGPLTWSIGHKIAA